MTNITHNSKNSNPRRDVRDYLCLLGYAKSDTAYLRAIPQKGNAENISYPVGGVDFKRLQELNSQGYGIYVVVNGGGHKDADVKHGKAIFYEHDELPKEEQKQLWRKLNLPEPTIQIDTGGKSIHSYWVFDKPMAVANWKVLQTDLLEYSDGDRSIKNQSRVMRVPGFIHQKSGNAGEIISQSGKRYSYEQLRQAIPTQRTQTFNFSQPTVTHLDAVPLEKCLSKDDRVLIDSGESQGKRNTAGAKLARSLLGAAKRLDHLGYPYRGDARKLFDDYCSRSTPTLDSKEANQIWKSAERDNPTATLTDDALENCVKAWQRQNREPKSNSTSKPSKSLPANNVVDLPVPQLQQWEAPQVEKELSILAEDRPKKVRLTRELKKLSQKSQWSVKDLRNYFQEVLEEQDKKAELEDDIAEFNEILDSNEPLPCDQILPKNLHPLLKFAHNLGVNPEPALVALEAATASLIHPETRIVGRKCSDYEEVPIIFSAIVGEPGSKKSPIINAVASKPLGIMEREANEQYNAELAEYERALTEWEDADKQDRGDKPKPPNRRQYFTGDYTPEALREIAQDNPKILRWFDELAKEANSRGRYTHGKGGEAQQLLESYDGYLPPMDRKGKHYPSLSVNQCLLGGIQPEVLSSLLSSADPAGEFARYNVATLVKKPHYWDGDSEVSIDITSLLVGIYKAVDELSVCKFNLAPEAYKIFEKYHNYAETKANEETKPALIYQYSKADGKILRWAMLYHILEAVANGQVPSETIDKRPMQIAALRMRYQINQVRAILARMESNEPSKLSQIYQLALRKNQEITPREVKRAGHVKDISEAVRLFRRLEEMGQGRVIKTSQTHKFEAYSEPKTGEVAEGGRRWQQTTVTPSNNLSSGTSGTSGDKGGNQVAVGGSKVAESTATPSNNLSSATSDTSDNKGGSKVAVESNPYTAKDTPEMWQDGSTPFSDSENNQAVKRQNDAKVAVDGSKVTESTATLSNNLESSNSPTSGDKGGSKAATESIPDPWDNTTERWQGGSTSFFKQEATYSEPQSIDDFKVGQKVHYNGSYYLWGIVASIEKEKGLVRDTDGAAYRWERCTIVNNS